LTPTTGVEEFGNLDPHGSGVYSKLSDCLTHGLLDGQTAPVPITLAVEKIEYQIEGGDENPWAHVSLTVYRNNCDPSTQFQIGVVNLMTTHYISELAVRWWAFPVA
jgi:hypothetical protein